MKHVQQMPINDLLRLARKCGYRIPAKVSPDQERIIRAGMSEVESARCQISFCLTSCSLQFFRDYS